jgi:hypothetical protein
MEIKKYNQEYYLKNKEDLLKAKKLYRQENKEKIKAYKKEYYKKNKEKVKTKSKLNAEKNKDKVRETKRIYVKNRRDKDSLFKLKDNIYSLIGSAFRRKNISRNSRTHEILGCSFEELKQHIESLWQPWMNWDNYGKYNGEPNFGWDIDHKTPLSSALNEEELLKLNRYSNLQPLCSYINRNIKKGSY